MTNDLSDEMKSSMKDFHAWYVKNGLAWGAGDMFVVAAGKPAATRITEVIAILADYAVRLSWANSGSVGVYYTSWLGSRN